MSTDINNALERFVDETVGKKLPDLVAAQLRKELASQTAADTEEVKELRRIAAKEFLTKREAAIFLNVSESHIDNLRAEGSIPEAKIGTLPRFRRSRLIEWAEESSLRRAS